MWHMQKPNRTDDDDDDDDVHPPSEPDAME